MWIELKVFFFSFHSNSIRQLSDDDNFRNDLITQWNDKWYQITQKHYAYWQKHMHNMHSHAIGATSSLRREQTQSLALLEAHKYNNNNNDKKKKEEGNRIKSPKSNKITKICDPVGRTVSTVVTDYKMLVYFVQTRSLTQFIWLVGATHIQTIRCWLWWLCGIQMSIFHLWPKKPQRVYRQIG